MSYRSGGRVVQMSCTGEVEFQMYTLVGSGVDLVWVSILKRGGMPKEKGCQRH
jgi:hypothetical protein